MELHIIGFFKFHLAEPPGGIHTLFTRREGIEILSPTYRENICAQPNSDQIRAQSTSSAEDPEEEGTLCAGYCGTLAQVTQKQHPVLSEDSYI